MLQDQEIEPLGSNKVFKVDVRIIAATSIDLKQLVKEGRFRSDLYYRLNVLPIAVPPLRERLSDLEALCEMILEQIAARTGLPPREITASAIATLSSYDWPGNVRELRNVLERATMLTDNCRLTAEDFADIAVKKLNFDRPSAATQGFPTGPEASAASRSGRELSWTPPDECADAPRPMSQRGQ